MGQGLRIWDENGVNLVDTDYRMTQIISSVYTADLLANMAYMNGNIHVPEFSSMAGTPFVLNIPTDHIFNWRSNRTGYCRALYARIEGNYIKWNYPDKWHKTSSAADYAHWIIWGVY